MTHTNPPRFIVDMNTGKLARLLRLLGYDAEFFVGQDSLMVTKALAEGRIILTRDTRIMERRVIACGRLKALLIKSDNPDEQVRQVIVELPLGCDFRPFTRCLECNRPLEERSKEQVATLVPPHVFQTRDRFWQCPACGRTYWRGTHWQRMSEKLARIRESCLKGE